MVGDAISHSVLPGIVIAYLIAQTRNSFIMLFGAAMVGLLTTFLIEVFYKRARINADASIGITFTWLFAIGVVLVSAFSGNVDLDQECVLYGDIAYVPFDIWYVADTGLGPVAVWHQGINLLIVTTMLIVGYRGFLITAFDGSFAKGLGINTDAWHYILMGAISFTVVLSFNAVGAILVVAFLVVPPATAYLLSKRMYRMIALTVLFGVLASVMGYFLSIWWNASISGAMAVAAGINFAIVFAGKQFERSYRKTKLRLS